jgi:hypothetical protein
MQLELSNYNTMTNQEKDLFWLDTTGKYYNEISDDIKVLFNYISFCVKLYLESKDNEKEILWSHYHPLCKRLSDYNRYMKEKD